MVAVTTPGGLEGFFEEVGLPATDRSSPPLLAGPPELGKMAATARKYDLEITGPPPR